MAKVNKSTLKSYFAAGDIPTQGQYANLIDSQFNLADTETQIIDGILSASSCEFEFMKHKYDEVGLLDGPTLTHNNIHNNLCVYPL